VSSRRLIVNADDLGLSEAVNEGIFAAHEGGIVTSTSLMVLRPAAAEAVARLSGYPDLGFGLHLEAGDFRSQLDRFRELLGRDPDHLDSHKHIHEAEPVSSSAEALAAELGIPLRNREVRYEGSFFARAGDGTPRPAAISPARLISLIENLPEGWTEIGCHPAAGPVPTSSYDAERQVELRTLCDPRVKILLNVSDVQLCSFAQVPSG
jgi:predicted glycoside hydrolase/deacetylase ChbG (UPF0249 family)